MIIWLLFSAVAILLAYLGDPANSLSKKSKVYQVLLSMWLAWFVSFGGGAMQDQPNYMSSYKSLASFELFGLRELLNLHLIAITGVRSGTEIGYVFLSILFNILGFSYIGFSFFFSTITNLLLVNFIYRFRYPAFIVLVFITTSYYTQQANLVRQMMTVSIFLFSTKYILERKAIKYFALIFIASLFHASSLLLLPLYFFANLKYPKYILLAILSFSIFLNFDTAQFGFIEYLQTWKVFYYDFYLTSEEGVGANTGINWIVNVILILFLAFENRDWKKDPGYSMILNLFFIGVVILNFRVVSDWFFRISLYFTIAYIVLVPVIVNYLANTKVANFVNYKMIRKYLIYLIILYHSYILLSYSFRPDATGSTLGKKMYTFSEMFKY